MITPRTVQQHAQPEQEPQAIRPQLNVIHHQGRKIMPPATLHALEAYRDHMIVAHQFEEAAWAVAQISFPEQVALKTTNGVFEVDITTPEKSKFTHFLSACERLLTSFGDYWMDEDEHEIAKETSSNRKLTWWELVVTFPRKGTVTA